MLQLNLLPDVKKEYIKAKKQKNVIFSVSILSAGVALAIVVILFITVQFVQKKSINDLTDDIKADIATLQSKEDLGKILTIQNQLNSLTSLHQDKPQASRLYAYLNQVTPADVKIGSLNIDFVESTIRIEGNAPSIASINRYADTLKFTGFTAVLIGDDAVPTEVTPTTLKIEDLNDQNTAFKDVITELSRNESQASYSITLTFNPVLFDNTQTVTLSIPAEVTTRSTLGKPTISSTDENTLFEDIGGEE